MMYLQLGILYIIHHIYLSFIYIINNSLNAFKINKICWDGFCSVALASAKNARARHFPLVFNERERWFRGHSSSLLGTNRNFLLYFLGSKLSTDEDL